MGPDSEMQAPVVVSPIEADRPAELQLSKKEPAATSPRAPRSPEPAARGALAWSQTESKVDTLRVSAWLFRSREASFLWLLVRLWLGYQWINAGYQKIWGSEHGSFWFGSGAGVKGFATAGVLGSAGGKTGASYGWWAGFLHNFVIPNASWIAKLVSLGEILIGVALIVGLFTGVAAAGGLLLNLTYMFSGSAGVNPMYASLSVLLILAWRNAGWIGLDRLLLRNSWASHRAADLSRRVKNRRTQVVPAVR
ncbi:MAG: DoxX family protein [Acidimicrobiales bacterium]